MTFSRFTTGVCSQVCISCVPFEDSNQTLSVSILSGKFALGSFSYNMSIQVKLMLWKNYEYLMALQRSYYAFKGDTFASVAFVPFWKGVYSKRKEFAPHGSKFFPFRVVYSFSEGDWCEGMQTASHKTYLPRKKNGRKFTMCIQSP